VSSRAETSKMPKELPPESVAQAPKPGEVLPASASDVDKADSSNASADTASVSGAPYPPYQLSQVHAESRNADRVPRVPVGRPEAPSRSRQGNDHPVAATKPKPARGPD